MYIRKTNNKTHKKYSIEEKKQIIINYFIEFFKFSIKHIFSPFSGFSNITNFVKKNSHLL